MKKYIIGLFFIISTSCNLINGNNSDKKSLQIYGLNGPVKTESILIFYDKNSADDKNSNNWNINLIRTYNEDGYITEMHGKQKNEYNNIKSTYAYDENNNVTEMIQYDNDNNIVLKGLYSKTEDVLDNSYYTPDNKLAYKMISKYNKNNDMIECETYNSDEQLAKKETYTRDNDGKIIEQCDFKPDGSLGIKIACKYNNGDLIEENVYNAEGKCIAITTYNYTYDSNNNWLTKETYIKNTTTNNNRFKSKEVRTIEYYD